MKEDLFSLKIKFYVCRESLSAQLELTLTMVDSEQLARSIAEEQVGCLWLKNFHLIFVRNPAGKETVVVTWLTERP